ncbi:MAG: type module-associated protein Cmr5 [Pseudomonadota bacterium]|jgi:CRISPR-associated protein Cmr5
MPQTMQQKRAKFALDEITKAIKSVKQKEYKSYAASMPFMIKANGLGQTAAFYYSKGGTHKELYTLLSEWLKQEIFKGKDLLTGITESDMHTYLAAQAEALVFLQWVKQFANAFMDEEKTDVSSPEPS